MTATITTTPPDPAANLPEKPAKFAKRVTDLEDQVEVLTELVGSLISELEFVRERTDTLVHDVAGVRDVYNSRSERKLMSEINHLRQIVLRQAGRGVGV